MTRIERLEAAEVIGNAYDDRDLLNLAHEIAADCSEPFEVRCRALLRLDRVMGETAPAGESELQEYLEFCGVEYVPSNA